MKHKKSVLKSLLANSECFSVSAGIAPNTRINVVSKFGKLLSTTVQNYIYTLL